MKNLIAKKIKNRTSDGILKHSTVYISFTIIVTAINILFRKYISSNLIVEDFGIYSSLIAFYSIITAPLAVMPMYMTKMMSFYNGQKEWGKLFAFHKKIAINYILFILFYSLTILIISPFVSASYHIHTILPFALIIITLICGNLSTIYNTALQSFQKFRQLGLCTLLGNVVKFLAAILIVTFTSKALITSHSLVTTYFSNNFSKLFLASGFTYNWAFIAGIIGALSATFLAFLFFLKQKRQSFHEYKYENFHFKHFIKDILPILALLVMFEILRNIDQYFARHFLNPHDNGLYGAAASIGKSSIFLVAGISAVIFPKLSAKINDPLSSRRIMLKALLLTSVGFFIGLTAVLLFPNQIITILTHKKYLGSASILKWFFIAYLPYSFIMLFVQFFMVNRSYLFAAMLIVMGLTTVVLFQIFHSSLQQLILVLGITGYTTLIFSIILWLRFCSAKNIKEKNTI